MIREHDHAHSGFLSRLQYLSPSALGMVRILRVNVKQSPVILINPRRRRRMRPNLHPFDTLGMNSLQMLGFQALNRTSSEQEGGNQKEGENTHNFIVCTEPPEHSPQRPFLSRDCGSGPCTKMKRRMKRT